MKQNIKISGFADEISQDFDAQLATVTALGMRYISLRSADGKNVADYTAAEAEEKLLPRQRAHGVGVSSLGSPIGKIPVEDEAAFAQDCQKLEELCKMCGVLGCRYIRIFSFYLPQGADPERYGGTVLAKLRRYDAIAQAHGVVLLHENEKGIYGDTGARCKKIFEALASPHFRAAFDFANFVQCGEDPAACWDLLAPYIEYIHIKDAVTAGKENVLCGEGEGKIAPLLARAIRQEGYEGFLTLEPHLVVFESLGALEAEQAQHVTRNNKAKDGAEGYAMQYRALCKILDGI